MSKEHTGLPNTPEEIRAFIGKSFSSLQFGQDNELPHENDTYTLTAHDLISAFQWAEIDAPMSAEPTDDEIIDIAVEPLGIDCDRMPYGVVVFARALLSRYSSAPVATQAQLGEDIIVNCPDNVYTLPLRSSGLTQGPRFVVHVPAQTSASAELECSHCGGTGDVSGEYPGVACPACGGTGKAAPVAAQPGLTQQTLDDVMAGIPARDAEIEALRKEIEALQAAPVKPYSLDLDPAGIRALTADAISGALALGFQGVSPPPNNEHWLAPFWEIGRESAVQAQQPVSGADGLPQGWRMVPEKIPMKGLDDAIAWMRPAMNQAGRDLAYCLTGAWSILLDSVTPPDHLPDATKMVEPSGNSGELHASFESWRKSELPWTSPATPGIGFAWDAWRARAALAQQDADKVDAERYRAWRDAACKNDRTLIDAMFEYQQKHFKDGLPTPEQFNAGIDYALSAIDAARKEQA